MLNPVFFFFFFLLRSTNFSDMISLTPRWRSPRTKCTWVPTAWFWTCRTERVSSESDAVDPGHMHCHSHTSVDESVFDPLDAFSEQITSTSMAAKVTDTLRCHFSADTLRFWMHDVHVSKRLKIETPTLECDPGHHLDVCTLNVTICKNVGKKL